MPNLNQRISDRWSRRSMRYFGPVLLAILTGAVQFIVMQADHASERDYWRNYTQGAAAKHEFWDRYSRNALQARP